MDQLPFPLPLYLQQPGKGARGEPQVPPVDLPAANQEYSIIFAAASLVVGEVEGNEVPLRKSQPDGRVTLSTPEI